MTHFNWTPLLPVVTTSDWNSSDMDLATDDYNKSQNETLAYHHKPKSDVRKMPDSLSADAFLPNITHFISLNQITGAIVARS